MRAAPALATAPDKQERAAGEQTASSPALASARAVDEGRAR